VVPDKKTTLRKNVLQFDFFAIVYSYSKGFVMSRWKTADQQVRDSEVQLRAANAALRESEQKFRSMVEIIPDWVWQIDQNGIYTYSSPKVKDILGYEPEEIIGKSPFDFMPKDEGARVRKIFGELVASHAPIEQMENTGFHKDGRLVVLETSGVAIYDDQGSFIGYGGVDRDITERKRVEISLLESEKKFKNLTESAPVGIAITTPEGSILEANPAILKILNCDSKEHFLNDSILSFYNDPIDRQYFITEMKKCATNAFEFKFKRSDGTVFWGALTSSKQVAEDGTTYFISTLQDIDERKKNTVQLSEIRRSLAEAQHITHIGNWDWNLEEDELFWSDEMFKIFDVYPNAFTGKYDDFINVVHPDDRAHFNKHVKDVLEDRVPFGIDCRLLLKDGSIKHIEAKGKVFRDENGNPIRMIGTNQDITERMKSEQEREQLMSLLTEKTQQMESLLRIVTHDLRSPLVNIAGFSQELESDSKEIVNALDDIEMDEHMKKKLSVIANESIPDSLNFIVSSTKKMEALINSLSKLSKLGQINLNIETIDMEALMEEIVTVSKFKARELGAAIEVSTLPECAGDVNQVNQVFANLVSNALKYLDPEKTGVIKIIGKTDGNMSIYCVEDNGIGIPDNHKEKIFEIFHRVDAKSPVAGEGIGLTAVKQILGRLNGLVWVESESGEGSRFFVSLPNTPTPKP
jgi:PAS domain S-box-containing protein